MPRFPVPYITKFVLCGALVTFSNGVYPETSSVDAPESAAAPPTSTAMPQTPRRGMRMEDVQARFGVPSARLPAVGEPPITRWIYDRFTVYFERRYVVHSVPNQ